MNETLPKESAETIRLKGLDTALKAAVTNKELLKRIQERKESLVLVVGDSGSAPDWQEQILLNGDGTISCGVAPFHPFEGVLYEWSNAKEKKVRIYSLIKPELSWPGVKENDNFDFESMRDRLGELRKFLVAAEGFDDIKDDADALERLSSLLSKSGDSVEVLLERVESSTEQKLLFKNGTGKEPVFMDPQTGGLFYDEPLFKKLNKLFTEKKIQELVARVTAEQV